MPTYTVETTYRVPVCRQPTYAAATPAEACRQAIEDDDWSNDKLDYEAAGETYVTGIWLGADAAYSSDAVPVPSHFDETIQRKAAHFEVLFGLLRLSLPTKSHNGGRMPIGSREGMPRSPRPRRSSLERAIPTNPSQLHAHVTSSHSSRRTASATRSPRSSRPIPNSQV